MSFKSIIKILYTHSSVVPQSILFTKDRIDNGDLLYREKGKARSRRESSALLNISKSWQKDYKILAAN